MLARSVLWVAGAGVALALTWIRGGKSGVPKRRLLSALALTVFFSVFFSRFLYCAVQVEAERTWTDFFRFWDTGHMLYGGLLGGLLAMLLCGGKTYTARLADAFAPSGALTIAVFRVSEGLSGQGYGEYAWEESVWQRFPFMVYDAEYESWAWALFVLAALLALALFAVLLFRRPRFPGDGMLLMLAAFAAGQIVLESLRRDGYLRWGFVRCEELFSAVTVGAALLAYQCASPGGRRLRKALHWSAYGLLIVMCILLEFATEGRVPFLSFLDVNGCYWSMAAACCLLLANVLGMRALTRTDAKETNL